MRLCLLPVNWKIQGKSNPAKVDHSIFYIMTTYDTFGVWHKKVKQIWPKANSGWHVLGRCLMIILIGKLSAALMWRQGYAGILQGRLLCPEGFKTSLISLGRKQQQQIINLIALELVPKWKTVNSTFENISEPLRLEKQCSNHYWP